MKSRLFALALLSAVLLAACSPPPTNPSAISATGDGSSRVVALGESTHTPTPGANTGTAPNQGAPNSCPTQAPVARKNENNGKFDLIIDLPVNNTQKYRWDVYVLHNNQYEFLRTLWSYTNDGRQGRYQQWEKANARPEDLAGTGKQFTVTPVFIGCGDGATSKPVQFDGPAPQVEESPTPTNPNVLNPSQA